MEVRLYPPEVTIGLRKSDLLLEKSLAKAELVTKTPDLRLKFLKPIIKSEIK